MKLPSQGEPEKKPAAPGRGGSSSGTPTPLQPQPELAAVARQEARVPLWKDFAFFLLKNKKWWLLPILVILLGLSLLMLLSSSAVAPFIYTLF